MKRKLPHDLRRTKKIFPGDLLTSDKDYYSGRSFALIISAQADTELEGSVYYLASGDSSLYDGATLCEDYILIGRPRISPRNI